LQPAAASLICRRRDCRRGTPEGARYKIAYSGERVKKQVPEFRVEEDEREFWAKNDSTEFIDWQSAQKHKLPELKRSEKNAEP
jgi:hypothetical protein